MVQQQLYHCHKLTPEGEKIFNKWVNNELHEKKKNKMWFEPAVYCLPARASYVRTVVGHSTYTRTVHLGISILSVPGLKDPHYQPLFRYCRGTRQIYDAPPRNFLNVRFQNNCPLVDRCLVTYLRYGRTVLTKLYLLLYY